MPLVLRSGVAEKKKKSAEFTSKLNLFYPIQNFKPVKYTTKDIQVCRQIGCGMVRTIYNSATACQVQQIYVLRNYNRFVPTRV